MLSKLLLIFIAVPLIELAILVKLGTVVGFWPTLALVLGTGAAGAALARSQGTRVLRGIQAELAAGRMPTGRLLDGLMILAGGILLLTPGLLTDLSGLTLLIPFTRKWFKQKLRNRFERMLRTGQASVITVRSWG